MNSTSAKDRRPAAGRSRRGVRAIIVLLVSAVFALLATHGGELYRRARFAATGEILIEGIALKFAPNDEFTELLLENGPWEPQETRLLISLLRPGDTFIDIGAYVGYYALLAARRVGPTGRVIAFEPAPKNFDTLRRNVRLNRLKNVTLERKAVADKPKTLRLFLDDLYGMNHTIADQGEDRRYINVEAIPLDDYLATVDFSVDLVKIDAEGAEGVILGGMKRTLARFWDIKLIFEFSPELLRKTGLEPEEVIESLRQKGFESQVVEEGTPGRRLAKEEVPAFLRAMRLQGRSSENLFAFRPSSPETGATQIPASSVISR